MTTGYELRFKNGDIVYWCRYVKGKCHIHFGMVDTQYSDAVCIDLLVPKDFRTIEGVPIEEWTPDNRERKLPVGWTYDTRLFQYGYIQRMPQRYERFICGLINEKDSSLKDKAGIADSYKKGYLVKSKDRCHLVIKDEIGKGTYTLKVKYSRQEGYANGYGGIDCISVKPDKVYETYEEALKEKNEYEAEFRRIQSLSDLDWSVEQIDNTLERWTGVYCVPDTIKNKYREFLLSLSDLENVEVRIFNKDIQWKYWRNSRWRNIEASNF